MASNRQDKTATKRAWLWVPTLYFAQGLPYAAVMTLSVILYKRLGLSNTATALYTGWLYLPWVVKPLWSPVVDLIRTKRWWTLLMQWAMALGFGAIAISLDTSWALGLSLVGFSLTAFFSATHDIAADGLYIISLDDSGQALFAGIRTMFYRIAMVVVQGALVMAAGWLETTTGSIPLAWSIAIGSLSATFALLAAWHSFTLPHPAVSATQSLSARQFMAETLDALKSFFTKPGAVAAILFMLLYKLPEAQLLKLISPFMLDPASAGGLGMTTAQVGLIYGTVGVVALIVGGVAGGAIVAAYGLRRCLMPIAWCMSLTCGIFLWLSYMPAVHWWVVMVSVAVEQLGYGLGTTVFILYLMKYSEGPRATIHYAICTGIMALGMMLPGMAAGWIQTALGGYQGFFWWTMACCIATIAVSWAVRRHL